MKSLFPDQQESIDRLIAAMQAGKRHILLQGATGSGKSVIATELIRRSLSKNNLVWFMVPRRDLIRQMHEEFADAGIDHGYIAAGYEHSPFEKVYICSIDSLRTRLHKVKPPKLVFIDETHHGGAGLDTIIQWLKANGTWTIGLSATPWKLSGKGLGCWYDELICGPSIRWLIDNKRLSEYKAFAPDTPDLSMIGMSNGDYAKGQLSERMEQDRVLIGNSVKHYKNHAMGMLGVTFAVSRKHSEMLAQAYRDNGVPAVHMDGETPEDKRIEIAKAFARREILQLCNAELLTFGYDLASASGYKDVCIQVMNDCQPTKSLSKQRQKNGRALRYDINHHFIFDHAGNIQNADGTPNHGLPCSDVEWTLSDREKRTSDAERSIAVRQCLPKGDVKGCGYCHPPAPKCPNCNRVYQVEYREVKEVDGELREIEISAEKKEKRMQNGRAKTLADLQAIAKERGYKNGWIYKQAKLKGITS